MSQPLLTSYTTQFTCPACGALVTHLFGGLDYLAYGQCPACHVTLSVRFEVKAEGQSREDRQRIAIERRT